MSYLYVKCLLKSVCCACVCVCIYFPYRKKRVHFVVETGVDSCVFISNFVYLRWCACIGIYMARHVCLFARSLVSQLTSAMVLRSWINVPLNDTHLQLSVYMRNITNERFYIIIHVQFIFIFFDLILLLSTCLDLLNSKSECHLNWCVFYVLFLLLLLVLCC